MLPVVVVGSLMIEVMISTRAAAPIRTELAIIRSVPAFLSPMNSLAFDPAGHTILSGQPSLCERPVPLRRVRFR